MLEFSKVYTVYVNIFFPQLHNMENKTAAEYTTDYNTNKNLQK